MKHIPMGRRTRVTNRPKSAQKRPAGEAPAGSAFGETAINRFIDQGLHELYDRLLNDPVPDDLMRLIEDDRKK